MASDGSMVAAGSRSPGPQPPARGRVKRGPGTQWSILQQVKRAGNRTIECHLNEKYTKQQGTFFKSTIHIEVNVHIKRVLIEDSRTGIQNNRDAV